MLSAAATGMMTQRERLHAIFGESPLFSTFAPENQEVAERAVRGEIRFRHLGIRYFDVGRRDIAWDAPQHQHQEWPAQLNRFFQLPSLAAAYVETGNEAYAEAARDYIADWIRAHPSREDWTIAGYDNTLNLCIRMQNWTLTLPDFFSSPAFDATFVEEVLASITTQLHFLTTHLTPNGNWRIAQADALMLCGIVLADLPAASAWTALAARVLNDAFHRQVLDDGAHIERNPGYHHWMAQVFTRYWRIQQAMPALGLSMDTEKVARMHDYNVGTTLPNGATNGLHDNNNQRSGPSNTQWLQARADFRRAAVLPDTPPPTTQYFAAAGQAFLRESWEDDAVCLTFDATTWGGGHCHLSRNAVQLYAYGRLLVLDPGTLTYELSDPMMAHGKSTRAHNTINLNGLNQSFANPTDTRCVSVPGYDLVSSQYTGGYWPGTYTWGFFQGHGPGTYGEHFRALLWIRNRCAVVFDYVMREYTDNFPTLESNWQLCEGPIDADAEGCRVVTRQPDANVLLCFPLVEPDMRLTVHEGESAPPRGWLPGDGAYVAAPQLCLSGPMTQVDAFLATVLVPFRGTAAPEVRVTGEHMPGAPYVKALTLQWGDGTRDLILATPRLAAAIGRHGEVETDAALLHLHYAADGTPVRGYAHEATYVTPFVAETRTRPETFTFSCG